MLLSLHKEADNKAGGFKTFRQLEQRSESSASQDCVWLFCCFCFELVSEAPEAAFMFVFICHITECKFLYIIGPERVEVLKNQSLTANRASPPQLSPPPRCWCTNRLWNFWIQLKLYREGQLTGMTEGSVTLPRQIKKKGGWKWIWFCCCCFSSQLSVTGNRAAWKNGGKRWFHPFQQTSDRVLLKGAGILKRTTRLWARSGILPPADHHSLLLSVAKAEIQTRISIDPNFSFLVVLCSELRSPSSYLSSSPETLSPPRIPAAVRRHKFTSQSNLKDLSLPL